MSGDLEGKRAIVTGGGSGIGKGIARVYADAGADVVITGRSFDRLEAAAQQIGPKVRAIQADVSREADVLQLFRDAFDDDAPLDILVNNAGAFAGDVVDDLELDDWQRVLDVNVTGVFLCSREAFRRMRPNGGGRIINIGSISANRARMHSTAYAASKHAVWGLTQALALDGRDDGIIVSCLNPGNTAVERRVGGRAVAGRDEGAEDLMTVDDVAQLALLMAILPPNVNLLEATILPVTQPYIGRG